MLAVAMGATWPAYAANMKNQLPLELLYEDEPIPPLCFDYFAGDRERKEVVDLRTCGNYTVPHTEATWRADGSYGYEFLYRDKGFGNPYVYYRYIGRVKELPVVLIHTHAESDEHRDALVRVRRDGHYLYAAEYITQGDRCNGGLAFARMEQDRETQEMVYGKFVTPLDIVSFSEDIRLSSAMVTGLESAPVSCFGIATYDQNEELTGVYFDKQSIENAKDKWRWTEKFPLQSCFNAYYQEYTKGQPADLNKTYLNRFVEGFYERCAPTEVKPAS